MGGPPRVCMRVTDSEPWVKPFDIADEQGIARTNGQIDKADLEHWAWYLRSDLRDLVESFPNSSYCDLFKWDMVRQRFLFRVVQPELERTTPLDDEERKLRAANTLTETLKTRRELETHSNQMVKSGFLFSRLYGRQIFVFRIALLESVEYASMGVLTSLSFETPKMYGLGIGFEKEVGSPARITKLEPYLDERQNYGPLKVEEEITAIDGQNTIPMTQGEVWSRLRGPKDSELTLTLSPRREDYSKVTLQRQWLPLSFQ